MKNCRWFEVPYTFGKHEFSKGIRTTHKEIDTRQGDILIQFDMATVHLKKENGEEITIENEDFEFLMAEYIRRKKEIKRINRELLKTK